MGRTLACCAAMTHWLKLSLGCFGASTSALSQETPKEINLRLTDYNCEPIIPR